MDGQTKKALVERRKWTAARIDGAVQEGKDQPNRRLLADADSNSGLFLAL